MSFVYDQKVVDSMYGSHVVSMAVDYGVDLVKMWPLQTNQELENDVKYAENLQVMFSGMMTQVLLKRSEEVDQSVAEAVYEGMDVLPGVDPEIIRTLMDANRAYDVMASYHGVDGIELFMETARILGIDVETRIEKEIQDLMENLSRTMRSASGFEVDDDVAENVGICQSATGGRQRIRKTLPRLDDGSRRADKPHVLWHRRFAGAGHPRAAGAAVRQRHAQPAVDSAHFHQRRTAHQPVWSA